MTDKIHDDFLKFRMERNAVLAAEGHGPNSKFWINNCDYTIWEASRAAMRVKLPEVTGSCHYAYDPDELLPALDAAGVSYE